MWIRTGVAVGAVAALVFATLSPIAAQPAPCSGIHVNVLNIRNSTGTVDCALFDSPDGFPVDVLRSASRVIIIKVRNTEARCDFVDVPAGTYALAVVHDENMNGQLELNWLGVPTEGYGFSNDATALLGAPGFAAASFRFTGGTLDMTVSLRY